MQQGIAFSTVLYKNDVPDRPTSFFYTEKQSVLLCCRGKVELLALMVVIQLPPRWRNVVWNTKASANPSAFLFLTTFLRLKGYSATNTKTRALYLKSMACFIWGWRNISNFGYIYIFWQTARLVPVKIIYMNVISKQGVLFRHMFL